MKTTKTQELISSFIKEFDLIKEGIYKKIEDDNAIQSTFDDVLLNDLGSLKKILSEHMGDLPIYEKEKAQRTIETLESDIIKRRKLVLPKKKFTFKKRNPNKTNIQKKSNETLELPPESINSTGMVSEEYAADKFAIGNRHGEVIYLSDCGNVIDPPRLFKLNDCTVYGVPCNGSAFIDDCKACTFMLASQQVRIHRCTDCRFYLQVRSNPIIEDSTNVRFAPYSFDFPEKEKLLSDAGLGDDIQNRWGNVEDFNWLRNDQPSPNWSTIPENERNAHYKVL